MIATVSPTWQNLIFEYPSVIRPLSPRRPIPRDPEFFRSVEILPRSDIRLARTPVE